MNPHAEKHSGGWTGFSPGWTNIKKQIPRGNPIQVTKHIRRRLKRSTLLKIKKDKNSPTWHDHLMRQSLGSKVIPFEKLTQKEMSLFVAELKKSKPNLISSRKGESLIRWSFDSVVQENKTLVFATPDNRPQLSPQDNTPHTVNLGLDSGVYFLSTQLEIVPPARFAFDFSVPIFKIQRRKNFRCPTPPNTETLVRAYSDKSKGSFAEWNTALRDLGGRGASIFLSTDRENHPWEKVGTQLFVDLKTGDRKITGLAATVRHIELGSDFPWVGLEFTEISTSHESELSSLTLEFQRLWFQIYAGQDD